MPSKHKGGKKTWRKEPVKMEALPEIVNVRCCCTPKKILGIIPATMLRDLKLKYFGNEIAVYGDGHDMAFWNKQDGFVAA